ncbi:MAG: hypothetical protein HY438_02360 [DPANN group archaeon]|nr:hypothetical protein [DPANN group archaeon]
MVSDVNYCPVHSTLMMAGKCVRCETEISPTRGNAGKDAETGSPAFRACSILKSNHKTNSIMGLISSRLQPGQKFEQMYEEIINRKAGFVTAYFLAGLPEHNGHMVFLHPKTLNNIINKSVKYGSSSAFYSRIELRDSLCVLCQEGKADFGGLSLSSVVYGGATDLSDAYSAFTGYLLASPEVIFGKPAKPLNLKKSHKRAREFTY